MAAKFNQSYMSFVLALTVAVGTLMISAQSASGAKTEVDYNNREYVSIRNAALARRFECGERKFVSDIEERLSEALTDDELLSQFEDLRRELDFYHHRFRNSERNFPYYDGNPALSRSDDCYDEAATLTAPYRPSKSIRAGVRFRIIPDKACEGQNEGGAKGRRRWATCAAYCARNPRCISFEMGKVGMGKDRRCQISYSCTEKQAEGDARYDLWIIKRD